MPKGLRIGVVGCGIAGTSFALLALRAGNSVELFERTEHVGPVGAGVLLQPSGQRILRAMGLFESVIARAEPIREIHAVTHRGHDLIRLSYDEGSPKTCAYGLHRGDLFTVLHRSLIEAGVNLRLGRDIASCANSSSGATLSDRVGQQHGPFDLIVVADGARSNLREICGIRHTCHEYAYGALWAVGQSDAIRGRLFQVTRGSRRLCGILPMGDGRCSFFWGMRSDEFKRLHDNRYWDAWRKDVAELAPAASSLIDQIRAPDDLLFTTFRHTRMTRSHTDRLVLIGDAAHATSPHLGQGVNLALIDAWTLAASLDAEPAVADAVSRYAKARRSQISYYSLVTRILTPFFQSDGRLPGWSRDLALPLLSRITPVRKLMLATLRGEVFESEP